MKYDWIFEVHAKTVHSLIQHISLDDDITQILYCPKCGMCEFSQSLSPQIESIVCRTCNTWYRGSKAKDALKKADPMWYVKNILRKLPLKYGGNLNASIKPTSMDEAIEKFKNNRIVTYNDLTDTQIQLLDRVI